ncbi:MAG: V-type ATP synthase subunit E family protein [Sedimentisphaerales bacterium]|jgi:vacuolar-type H+-ATPase subunit E/Vma4
MEPVEKEKAALIAGIEEDARVEEKKIIEDAETQAAEKRQYAEKKVESILDEAREKAQEQAKVVKRKIVSGVDLEIKRMSMRTRDAIMQGILDRVEKKLDSMIPNAEYKSVLIDWLAEAGVGLGAEAAEVNASEKERALMDNDLLSQAAEKAHAVTGKQVTLTLSDARPLKSQGVVLTAADGHTAFNNQVRTRMRRRQREIRAMIYDALFTEDRKE